MHRAFALSLVILFTGIVSFSEQVRQPVAPATAVSTPASAMRAQAIQSLAQSSLSLQQLVQIQQQIMLMSQEQAKIYSALSMKVDDLSKLAAQKGTSQAELIQAIKTLQAAQVSFGLQYLQLQNSMQNEGSQFSTVSNTIKTNNGTAKTYIDSWAQ
jgi:translation elongation factor EF-1beta